MTPTDIANYALTGLNAKSVNSIDDDEVNAKRAKRFYKLVVEEVSASRPWACLRRRIKLAHAAEKRRDGFYAYIEPKNLLKITELFPHVEMEREGGFIFAPSESLSIECTLCFYDPDLWDVNLRRAVIARLKAELAPMVTGDPNLAANLVQVADKILRDCAAEDIVNSRERRNRERCGFISFDSFV